MLFLYDTKGDADMEKIFEQSLLYDFYGELLTEHQRKIYEDAVFGDLSLGEIARDAGISRQGVHDLIKRCDRALQEYEAKLHLLERFLKTKKEAEKIAQLAEFALATCGGRILREAAGESENGADTEIYLREIRDLSRGLIEEL